MMHSGRRKSNYARLHSRVTLRRAPDLMLMCGDIAARS